MGTCYIETALEWDESYASCWCSRFPESTTRNTQGSGSHGCKDNLGMLANRSELAPLILTISQYSEATAAARPATTFRPAKFVGAARDFCKFYTLDWYGSFFSSVNKEALFGFPWVGLYCIFLKCKNKYSKKREEKKEKKEKKVVEVHNMDKNVMLLRKKDGSSIFCFCTVCLLLVCRWKWDFVCLFHPFTLQ